MPECPAGHLPSAGLMMVTRTGTFESTFSRRVFFFDFFGRT